MALLVSALAGSGDPGKTAVDFLEKVRAKTVHLEPGGDTALSPQTSGQKRREIARRLDRMARDLGREPLEVGAVKVDDDLGAVLVRKAGGLDPSRLQVFAVALVKRGAEWWVAPVPASFENAGVGYAAIQRKRLASLEDWMLREQAMDLENLRDQTGLRMRREIAASLPLATLRNFNSMEVAERFLKACERRNLPEMLGLLGGLASHLPNDWAMRLKAAQCAVEGASQKRPWRLLFSGEVLRAWVHHEEDGDKAMVSLACLDPAGGPMPGSLPQVELVHLELSKSRDGLWRIDLPPRFLQGDESVGDDAQEELDVDLLDAFPAQLALRTGSTPQPTAAKAGRVLMETLQSGSPLALMRLIRLDGDAKAARSACVRAVQIWWSMRDSSKVCIGVPLAAREDGSNAVAMFQLFSAGQPDRMNPGIFYFWKSSDVWWWSPVPDAEPEKGFREWTDLEGERWKGKWEDVLLAESPKLEKLAGLGAPSEEEARQLIQSWFQVIQAGDVVGAIRLTARLNSVNSQTMLLRNLGYEMMGARRNSEAMAIRGIHRGELWTAVGAQANPDNKATFPLYPVIRTPSGPRILLEIDLFASAHRSRDFLNQSALNHLRVVDPPAADELKQLLMDHQSAVLKSTQP